MSNQKYACQKNGINELTNHIGPIKNTNWGGIADVKSIKKAYDLTMTTRALENHTDNPYRFPTQGYIFLHCLENSKFEVQIPSLTVSI